MTLKHSDDVLNNVRRIEGMIAANAIPGAWQQPINDVDKIFYRDYLLIEWDEAKRELEAAKEKEMHLRKACVAFAFNPEQKSGTERIELGNGYQAKAVKKINYGWIRNGEKIDKHAIDMALEAIEADGPVGQLIAERLVKWTPELSLTEYKQLEPNHKAIIDKVIVTTDGAPTLEILEPKAKK